MSLLKNIFFYFSFVLILSIVYSTNSTFAREVKYFVGGKVVPKNVYDAALLVNDANKLMKSNYIDRAIGKLKKATSLDSSMAHARCNLGILLARKGQNAEALIQLKSACQQKDCPAQIYLNLASLYQTTGNLEGAIQTYELLLEKYPNSSGDGIDQHTRDILVLLNKEKEKRSNNKNDKQASSDKDYFQISSGQKFVRWSSFRNPIKVYIQDAKNIDGYIPYYDTILKESFYDWSKASGNNIKFLFVDNKNNANIICFWTNDPAQLGNGTENGETKLKFVNQAIVKAEIALKAKESPNNFPFTDNTIYTTCRHEIGHAIGILGHSTNPNDVMYFSIPIADTAKAISERDRNTLLKIYSNNLDFHSLILDFIFNIDNWEKYSPLLAIFIILISPLLIIIKTKKKKKVKKKKI